MSNIFTQQDLSFTGFYCFGLGHVQQLTTCYISQFTLEFHASIPRRLVVFERGGSNTLQIVGGIERPI